MISFFIGGLRRMPFAALVLAAIAVFLAVSSTAQAQLSPREIRAAAVTTNVPQRPPSPSSTRQQLPKVAAPVFPTGGAGLCQCISDRTRRNMSCLGGAAACQSVCGTTNYSLVPNAAFSCPLASGEQPEQVTQ